MLGNWNYYSNPYLEEQVKKAERTADIAERTTILEELFVMLLDDAISIPLGWQVNHAYWWPWIKNYHGERKVAINLPISWTRHVWVDQDLKEEMR